MRYPASQVPRTKCYACHSTEGFQAKLQGKAIDISKKADFNTLTCTACHSSFERKFNAELLQSWESKYLKETEILQEDLNYIRNAAKTDEAILTGELKSKFESAGANIMLLVMDGSHGVHNFELTTKIMGKVREDLDVVKAVIK